MPAEEEVREEEESTQFQAWGRDGGTALTLCRAYKQSAIASGLSRGYVVAQEISPGVWSVTGGAGTYQEAGFVPGGGGFGGGGASGNW